MGGRKVRHAVSHAESLHGHETRLSRILRRVDLPTGGGTPSWTSEKVAAVGTIHPGVMKKTKGGGAGLEQH